MTQKTKELFEALTLLRYAAEHKTNDIDKYEIQDSYYILFDLLSKLKYIEDQDEMIIKAKQEQEDRFNNIHKKVMEKFEDLGAVEIAQDITERMNKLNIHKTYVITEMATGEIGIIDSSSDPNNKKILRTYTDKWDYLINIQDDLKVDFKREKLFSNMKTLKKGDHE